MAGNERNSENRACVIPERQAEEEKQAEQEKQIEQEKQAEQEKGAAQESQAAQERYFMQKMVEVLGVEGLISPGEKARLLAHIREDAAL